MNRQRGMTMVELMVSLAVVLLIIGAATTAYLKLLRTYKTQGKLAESYMANLTGLEMLRYDIEMAGFGLPAHQLQHCRLASPTPKPPRRAPTPQRLPTIQPLSTMRRQFRAARLRPFGQRRGEQFRCARHKIERSEPQPYEQEMVHDLPCRPRGSCGGQNVGGRAVPRSCHGLYRRSSR